MISRNPTLTPPPTFGVPPTGRTGPFTIARLRTRRRTRTRPVPWPLALLAVIGWVGFLSALILLGAPRP